MSKTNVFPQSIILLLAVLIFAGCSKTGVNSPQVYEPLLPDKVIVCSPESFLVEYLRHSCTLEIVRGEKPSTACKQAFPKAYQ